jgi:hypothetical protein
VRNDWTRRRFGAIVCAMVARAQDFGLHLTRRHASIFVGLFVAFTALTCWATSSLLSAGPHHTKFVIVTAASTLLGPLTGGISRGWQSCCAANSLSLLPYSGGALAVCLLIQFAPLPNGRWWARLRLLAWTAGWLVWFASGIVSLGHALE